MGWSRRRRAKHPRLHVAVDQGSGPSVVLLHGIASSWVTFQHLVPLIAEDHRVIAIDLLGFGQSPVPEGAEYTLEEHVAAVRRTLTRKLGRGTPFVLVGHSMGALITTRYAARYPRGIRSLVLVSPPVYLPPTAFSDPVKRVRMALFLRAYEYLRTHPDFTMRAAAQLAALSPIKGVLDISQRNWHAFRLSLKNLIEAQTTTITDIANARMPVYVVYGSLDPFLMPAALDIVEKLRGVRSTRVDGGDHVIRPPLARAVAAAIRAAEQVPEEHVGGR